MMESSLTRGSERTRSRSETVTTTAFSSGSMGVSDGVPASGDPGEAVGGGRADDSVGVAESRTRVGEGTTGGEPQAHRRAATTRTDSRRWRFRVIRRSVVDAHPGLDYHRAQEAFLSEVTLAC
jgi:hypothetical protein